MALRKWDEKDQVVDAIHQVIMYYWTLDGRNTIPRDNEPAWDDIIHSRTEQDWWDIVETALIRIDQYPEYMGPFNYLKSDMEEIEKRLHHGRDVTRPKNYATRSYNTLAWRALMSYKDFLNEIKGTPTPKSSPKPPEEPPTPFERLFD